MLMPLLFADAVPLFPWPPSTLWEAALASVLFGSIGIALVIGGFKIFDWLTPGDLQKEIFEKNNLSAAILAAAVVIGLCVLVAAVIG
jgi:putative membrane protein